MHDYAFAAKRFTRNAAQLTNILFSFHIFGSKILFAMQQTELDNQASSGREDRRGRARRTSGLGAAILFMPQRKRETRVLFVRKCT
jgi:hypothetical protein